MKLIAKKPCSFGGKDFFINDEIPVNAVLNPKQQEELGVLSIVSDGERVYINMSGNDGMATGGSGDVLSGIITGLMAQGLTTFEASALAVYIHGCAGDMCRKNQGTFSMKAWDIAESLSTVFTQNNTDYN